MTGPTGTVSPTDGHSPAQQHRADGYTPADRRHGVALCLSGGGFRSVLYHLGALTRLNELGLLSQVEVISCVSGGSIVGAVLADRFPRWPTPGTAVPTSEWQDRVVAPLVAFTQRDLRTGPILRRLRPVNWFRRSAAVLGLVDHYFTELSRLDLADLPLSPRYIFSSTDLVFGVDFTFERTRMGSYRSGYYTDVPRDWTVARAVAASSCFPPVFSPLPVGLPVAGYIGGMTDGGYEPARRGNIAGIELSDGGVYDNLGLEPVWKEARTLLVSDGGAPFSVTTDRGLLWRLKRYTDITSNAAGSLRKRWLVAGYVDHSFDGAFWGISSTATHYAEGAPGYPEELVRECIARIRTDLDAFSDAEVGVLQNHGYALADAAAAVHLGHLPQLPTPFALPHPEWADPERVGTALAGSDRRSILGRESVWKLFGKAVRG